jgi:4-diphosphocytidyl-2C-methyl-D-erythritol kinase
MTVVFVAPSLTGEVYAAMSPEERRGDGRVARLAASLAAGLPPDSTLLGSALEPAACRVSAKLSAGIAHLQAVLPGLSWHMTGSGGAVFCIASDHAHATSVAHHAAAAGFVARACRTVR